MSDENAVGATLAPDGTYLPSTPALIEHVEAIAAANAEDVAAKPETALSAKIEAWFVDQIHNSPASRDTPIFNYVRAAVDDLKQRVAAL